VIKGDVIASKDGVRLRIDAKSTASKDSIRISVDDIERNINNSDNGEVPVIVFSFKRHRRLYAVLQAGHAALFVKQKRKELRSERSILLKREEVLAVGKGECLALWLRGGRRYVVAELDAFLERLQRAEEVR
jgi:Holliday junction resolvase